MFSRLPGMGRWILDRIFPIIALTLTVALIAGLLGISAYLISGRRGKATAQVQAMTPAESPTNTPWPPSPSPTRWLSPTPRPTNTPVVVGTPVSSSAGETMQLTPLPTPSLPTPTAESSEASGTAGEMPDTGLGVIASAGLGVLLLGLVWGTRALRGRH